VALEIRVLAPQQIDSFAARMLQKQAHMDTTQKTGPTLRERKSQFTTTKSEVSATTSHERDPRTDNRWLMGGIALRNCTHGRLSIRDYKGLISGVMVVIGTLAGCFRLQGTFTALAGLLLRDIQWVGQV